MRLLLTKHINDADVSLLGNSTEVDFVPVISIEECVFECQDLKNKALIFTSVNAVKSFFNNSTSQQICPEQAIYCVGEQSEFFLKKKTFKTIYTAKNAEELSNYFIQENKDESYLHFCGDIALGTLEKTFKQLNKCYEKVISYTTTLTYPKYHKTFDAVVFFSPSGVRSFVKNNPLENKILFSIGETTSKELRNWTQNPIMTSEHNTTQDLLHLIRQYELDKK